MNRKEFLTYFWNQIFKPTLFVIAGAYCISYLYKAFSVAGNERSTLLLLTSVAIIYLLLYVIGRFFHHVLDKLKKRIPAFIMKILKGMFQIVSPLVFLFLLYTSWENDNIRSLILLAILLTEFIFRETDKQADRS